MQATRFRERVMLRMKREARSWRLWLMLLPALCVLVIFRYGPMMGAQIAFRDYKAARGIWGSKWVGFKHFMRFFNSDQFGLVIKNTLVLSLYSLIAGFPIPLILALAINSCPNLRLKKVTQTITYAPHFISEVVLCGMIFIFTASNTGIISRLYELVMGRQAPLFMGDPAYFPHIYVWTGIWQHMGWNSIIFVAALAGVSPDLYEAAVIDGATKLQQIRYIDLPSILPTAVTLLILNCGNLMSVGFEKALLLQNNLNISASQIISTYVYNTGLTGGQFSFASAVGLFNSVVNLILILLVNGVARRLNDTSLW